MNKKSQKDSFACIVPFYNENISSIADTVLELIKVERINSIILVDDGSDSKANFIALRNGFKNTSKVFVYRCGTNNGKSRAVSYGLKFVADEYVMLCDSDLKKLASEEISEALTKYELLKLDLLILRRMNIGFFPKIIRADTLLSGERILKKSDLEKVLEANVRGYELEVAINQYFIDDSSEKCAWSKSSAVNNYKYKKFKFLKGIYKDLKMYFAITKYIGFKNYLNQIKTFCRKEV